MEMPADSLTGSLSVMFHANLKKAILGILQGCPVLNWQNLYNKVQELPNMASNIFLRVEPGNTGVVGFLRILNGIQANHLKIWLIVELI